MQYASNVEGLQNAIAWSNPQQISGVSMSLSPSAASTPNGLYCAFEKYEQDDRSAVLQYISSPNGSDWSNPGAIPNASIADSPALTDYSGTLYCAYQLYGSDYHSGRLYMIGSADGSTWGQPEQVAGASISLSPALATFNNVLYCAYQGYERDDRSGKLFLGSSQDGVTWTTPVQISGVSMSNSPALAAFNNSLYCAYQGYGPNGQLMYTSSSDCATWSTPSPIAAAQMSESPALVVFNGRLYAFYQGSGHNGQLCYTSTPDGSTWATPVVMANALMSNSPAVATFNDELFCFYQFGGDHSGQLWLVWSGG
jgi:hypothetical protein